MSAIPGPLPVLRREGAGHALDEAALGRAVEAAFPEAIGVWLYGSFAHGRARRDSDIDLAILPRRPFDDPLGFGDRALSFGARLPRASDLVDLLRVSTVLRFEVVTGGRRIAARDPLRCDVMETAWVAMFQRLNEGQREHLEEIRTRGWVRG